MDKTQPGSAPRLGFLYFFDQRRNYVEQIPDDGVVGNLKNRRFGIFVDRDDGARAFHPNDVLNRAADAEREIELGGNRLARRTDLAVHREPAGVADRARSSEIAAEGLRELLGQFDVFLLLDAATYGDNDFSLREIDGLLGFFKYFLRLVANDAVCDFDIHGFDGSCTCACFSLISAERSVLECDEPGSIGSEADVGSELALKHLAGEDELSAFAFEADAIADDGASHGSRKLGNKVADLVGVRHQDELRLLGFEELLEGGGEGVGGVGLEFRGFDVVDLRDLLGGNFGGQGGHAGADHDGFESPAGGGGYGLAGGNRLPGDAVEFAFALFDDY